MAVESYPNTLLAFGLLSHLENQVLKKERIESVPQIGNIQLLVSNMAPRCCVQFYKLEIDDNFRIGDYILRISYTKQVVHMLCQVYFKDFYERLCGRYVGRSGINYSVKIDNNKRRVVDSKKGKEVPTVENLKQISLQIGNVFKMTNPQGMDEFWDKTMKM